MKTAKLIIGIISMVLFLIIIFQSCAAGVYNTLENNGETSGSAGFLLAFSMLIGGIVGVAGKNSKGATITSACFFALGAIIGFFNIGSFSDLIIWSILSAIFAVIFFIDAFKR